jgi:F-type H+-transporting ATPase subunit b
MEQAKGAIAAAEASTTASEDKLRQAKAEIYKAREEKLKQWNAERDAALEQVRRTAQDKIKVAKQEIEQSAGTARAQIEGLSVELSSKVLRAVLPAGVVPPEAAQ